MIVVEGDDFHYLKHVRRVKKGDSFDGLDAEGNTYRLTVRDEQRHCLFLTAESKEKEKISLPAVTLIQGLPKGKKMDVIIRQATEAGVSTIMPLLCKNSIVKIDNHDTMSKKTARWKRIAREAVQQSGASVLPHIDSPREIRSLSQAGCGIKLVFHQERENNRSLHESLEKAAERVFLCIGPEGGFTGGEIGLLAEYGFIPVHLGDSVLRVETAAIYAIAAVRIILLERLYWRSVCEE